MVEINKTILSNILQEGESASVEFKTSFNDEAIEAVGAFANAHGGMVLIGIHDSGSVVGLSVGKKTLEDIANRIQEATDPRLQPSLSLISYNKKNIIIIHVAASSSSPVSVKGRYFRRVGRSNQRMSHEEIMQRLVTFKGVSWDSLPENTATLDDLDNGLIERFIQTVRKLGRRSIPEGNSAYEILRKLELIYDKHPTRAALLLFNKNPGSFFASAFLKMGRFRSPTIIIDDKEAHGAIIEQLDEAESWFRERLQTEFEISDQFQRKVKWEYPLEAIREAICNSLCHRDYTCNAHSQIRLYDNRVEFWNAGTLPASLTPELLYQEHDSIPRNRKIAETFYNMGLIERWGTGTTRMAEQLRAENLPLPDFHSNNGRFRLIFHKNIFTKEMLQKLGLSMRQIQAVLYVKEHGSISNTEYQAITKISKATATRDLMFIKEKNIFITEGKTGRGTTYKLKDS